MVSLAKWLSVRLWTKWLWVRVQLQSHKYYIIEHFWIFEDATNNNFVFEIIRIFFPNINDWEWGKTLGNSKLKFSRKGLQMLATVFHIDIMEYWKSQDVIKGCWWGFSGTYQEKTEKFEACFKGFWQTQCNSDRNFLKSNIGFL